MQEEARFGLLRVTSKKNTIWIWEMILSAGILPGSFLYDPAGVLTDTLWLEK